MLKYKIGAFIHKPNGSRESFQINDGIIFDAPDDPKLTSKVKGYAALLKLPHEINVHITDLNVRAEARCNRCLKLFACDVNIPESDREFIIDLPKDKLITGEEVFYIDMERNEIDLTDMIREEIILHFPAVPLCFEGCKGLCDKCGINLNDKTCSCLHAEFSNTPLKLL